MGDRPSALDSRSDSALTVPIGVVAGGVAGTVVGYYAGSFLDSAVGQRLPQLADAYRRGSREARNVVVRPDRTTEPCEAE
ncbi:hypothetical protein ACQP0C_18165 [Nocardia sp. CA-129566]|uniref:hypothetical protein n=1 Tax=Nocardia sp. CA-129566 TaxID=3239976 RepID=UPI003D99AF6E